MGYTVSKCEQNLTGQENIPYEMFDVDTLTDEANMERVAPETVERDKSSDPLGAPILQASFPNDRYVTRHCNWHGGC